MNGDWHTAPVLPTFRCYSFIACVYKDECPDYGYCRAEKPSRFHGAEGIEKQP